MSSINTIKFKQNKTMRVGVVLALIALITLIGLTFTFAKYVSEGSGQDNARVAKWGLNFPAELQLNLFSDAYKGNPYGQKSDYNDPSNTVKSATQNDKVVAPGTEQNSNVIIANVTTAPEVMYDFDVDLKVTDRGDASKTRSAIALLDANPSWYWTVTLPGDTQRTFGTHAELENYVYGELSQKAIAPNNFPNRFATGSLVLNIGWKWDFEKSSGTPEEKAAQDAMDTAIGNFAADGTLDGLKIDLKVAATQVQGEHDGMYYVAFDTQGGSMNPNSQSIVKGGTATQPADPTRDGFEFKGWFKEATCTTPFNFTEAINANTIVYAKWTSLSPHRVDFKNQNGHNYYPVFSTVPDGVTFYNEDESETYGSMNANIHHAIVIGDVTIHTLRSIYKPWNDVFEIEGESAGTSYPVAGTVKAGFISANLVGGNELTEQVYPAPWNPTAPMPRPKPTYNGVEFTDIWNTYKGAGFGNETTGAFWSTYATSAIDSECFNSCTNYWGTENRTESDSAHVLVCRTFS